MGKAFLAIMICALVLAGAGSAGNLVGVECKKGVNNSYEISAPIYFDMQSRFSFQPFAYLKIRPIFSAPRGEFLSSMRSLNHSRFDAVLGSGITLFGGKLEFETGTSYWFAQNSEEMPEGWEFNNALRFFWIW